MVIPNDQVSDTTGDAKRYTAGNKKIPVNINLFENSFDYLNCDKILLIKPKLTTCQNAFCKLKTYRRF